MMEGACEECISLKDSLDSCDSDGFTVVCVNSSELSCAAQKGHDKCLEYFIQEGADVNRIENTISECPPLIRATQGGYKKCVELLLKAEADVNARNKNSKGQKNRTALMEASAKGHDKCVKLLIEAGADVNVTNPSGITPLVLAAKSGQDTCVDLLLKAGADVNHRCGNENTALICATIVPHNEQCIKLLLEGGADVNQTGKDGKTALMTAIQWELPSYVEILLKAGADVNLVDKSKENSLMKYLKVKKSTHFSSLPELFTLFLETGADVNAHFEGDHGNTPLMLAAEGSSREYVESLLKAGADVNATNNYGCTALMAATMSPFTSLHVEKLLEAEADVNMKDKWGRTALIGASMNSCSSNVESLINAGADVHVTDNCGRSPIDYAVEHCCGPEHSNVLELLIQAGADTELGCSTILEVKGGFDVIEMKVVNSDLRLVSKLYHKRCTRGTCSIRSNTEQFT